MTTEEVVLCSYVKIGELEVGKFTFIKICNEFNEKSPKAWVGASITQKVKEKNFYSLALSSNSRAMIIIEEKAYAFHPEAPGRLSKTQNIKDGVLGVAYYMDYILLMLRGQGKIHVLNNRFKIVASSDEVAIKSDFGTNWCNFSELYCISKRGMLYFVDKESDLRKIDLNHLIELGVDAKDQISQIIDHQVINMRLLEDNYTLIYQTANGTVKSLTKKLFVAKDLCGITPPYTGFDANSKYVIIGCKVLDGGNLFQLWSNRGRHLHSLAIGDSNYRRGDEIKTIRFFKYKRLQMVICCSFWDTFVVMAIWHGKLHPVNEDMKYCNEVDGSVTCNDVKITDNEIIFCGWPAVLTCINIKV